MRRILFAAYALAALVVAVAVIPRQVAAYTGVTRDITIAAGSNYEPPSVQAFDGDTLRWVNSTGAGESLISTEAIFPNQVITAGGAFSFTIPLGTQGTYHFRNASFSRAGTVNVSPNADSTATPTASPMPTRQSIFLPLIMGNRETATPTFTAVPPTATATRTPTATPTATGPLPTATPTATATPDPYIHLLGGLHAQPLLGDVTGHVRAKTLTASFGLTYTATGIFEVVFVNFGNAGNQSDIAYDLALIDSLNRLFDLASYGPNSVAGDIYDRKIYLDSLQPGLIYQMVFVFDVPTSATGLGVYSKRPW